MTSDGEQQGAEVNQEAFLDFLRQHYQQGGDQGGGLDEEGVMNLAKEMEDIKAQGGGVEEVTKLLQEKAPNEAKRASRQIRPEGVMCIKTWDVNDNKVIFNVCKSDSVDPPELVMRDGEEQTRLPMSMGSPVDDVDKKGEPCVVYDVVFNGETLADEDPHFTQFIVELTMMRVQEKYPERPAINAKKKWKKLKQREWKGREIVEQNIRDEPSVRVLDEESGLREFTTPEAAEPLWEVQTAKRKRDGEDVIRLRVELPGVRPEEITVRVSTEFIAVTVMQIGELKYKAECPCQRPEGYIHLSTKFHLTDHTLTLVWGSPAAKEFDDELAIKAAAKATAEAEAQRIQLVNESMFEIDCSSDDEA